MASDVPPVVDSLRPYVSALRTLTAAYEVTRSNKVKTAIERLTDLLLRELDPDSRPRLSPEETVEHVGDIMRRVRPYDGTSVAR